MLSTVSADGSIEVKLAEHEMPEPSGNQILVRIEATPINPSDLGVLFGRFGIESGSTSGSGAGTVLNAKIPDAGMKAMQPRLGQSLPIGNEGAGTVVAAGDTEAAKALIGKTVAVMGGGMFSQYRLLDATMAIPLGPHHTAKDGASSFVNPLTSLSFLEHMRLEGHTAIVHTAAASNLGQMLVKICQADGVELVNIVRKPEQVEILKDLGAKYVVNSSEPSFMSDLTDALHETGATIGFDATGGGRLASDILTAMEAAQARTPGDFSLYGSNTHKQVYLYGNLDMAPTMLARSHGTAWGVGGWLLTNFLGRLGPEVMARLSTRVATELTTTFASHYSDEISLFEALQTDTIDRYVAKATGKKFLIRPQSEAGA